MPQVGHAAVSKPPARMANNILRMLKLLAVVELVETPPPFLCFFMMNIQNFGQKYNFTDEYDVYFNLLSSIIKKKTIFAQNFIQ